MLPIHYRSASTKTSRYYKILRFRCVHAGFKSCMAAPIFIDRRFISTRNFSRLYMYAFFVSHSPVFDSSNPWPPFVHLESKQPHQENEMLDVLCNQTVRTKPENYTSNPKTSTRRNYLTADFVRFKFRTLVDAIIGNGHNSAAAGSA